MKNKIIKSVTVLSIIRLIIVFLVQLLFIIFLSLEKATPWWPFSVITAEAVCFYILVISFKLENKTFKSLYLKPFETLLPLGKFIDILNRKFTKNKFINIFIDLLLFIILLLILIAPSVLFKQFMNEYIPILQNTKMAGHLPKWALIIITVLLPLAQASIEFPWFYGYIYPKLETFFVNEKEKNRITSSVIALSVTVIFFVMQICLIPLIFDLSYMLWCAVSFMPLLLMIGVIIRLVPRFMMYANILHFFTAISVVMGYWVI